MKKQMISVCAATVLAASMLAGGAGLCGPGTARR